MSVLDGRVLENVEVQAATTAELVGAALDWVGQIRVEPNTHSSVAKQAACDLLLELKHRVAHGPS